MKNVFKREKPQSEFVQGNTNDDTSDERWENLETCPYGLVLCGCGRCHCRRCNQLCRYETGVRSRKDMRS